MIKLLKKKWKDYTIQLFLVMLGIVIPFLIAKWIDHIKDNRLEKQYIKMLYNDLDSDLAILVNNYDSIEKDRQTLISFIELNRDTFKSDANGVKKIIPIIVKYYHFIPSNSTFDELVSTGNMKLVSDVKRRAILFQYYKYSTMISKMEDAYGKETESFLKPTILKIFPIRRLAQYDFLYKNNPRFPISVEAISTNLDFENALLIKIDLLNNLRITYETLIKLNRKTFSILSK